VTVSDQPTTLLTDRTERGVRVLRVGLPELHGDAATEALVAEMVRAVDGVSAPRVALDCGAVGFITSMGIASLLRFWQMVRARGGKTALCGLSRHVSLVLTAARLTHADPANEHPFLTAPDTAAAVGLLAEPSA
jgi:anti-anti-sigma factor